ncbi:putative ATP-dependent RNA helicase Dbp21E2 [Amblyomma americanum]|uniref:RNA helicase n=1 Tax=Amblyomma americanum TaxID=6943 RepID=A0AAQ4EJF7_AMBAM
MSLRAASLRSRRSFDGLLSRQQKIPSGEDGEVLRTPVYLQHKLRKLRAKLIEKDLAEVQRLSRLGSVGRPVVSCRRPERNWNWGQTTVGQPLASAGWARSRSHGDHFTVHRLANVAPPLEADPFPKWLDPRLVAALEDQGITRPSPVQRECLDVLVRETVRPVLLLAEAGSGKTLAYLLPLLQNLLQGLPRALVVAPGRELAAQLAKVADTLAAACGLKARLLAGRRPPADVGQAQMLVSTPGVLSSGSIDLQAVGRVVLDEVDTLLDESFQRRVFRIVEAVRPDTQLVLVGAVRPDEEVLSELLGGSEDSLVHVTSTQLHRLLPHVEHRFMRVRSAAKAAKLMELLQHRGPQLVFVNSTSCCNWLGHVLRENERDAALLHGELPSEERRRHYARFASGETNLLVCTDLGSRGLDTSHAVRVINFDLPSRPADYLHRAGRVGRLQGAAHPTVISLVSSAADARLAQTIELAAREARAVDSR